MHTSLLWATQQQTMELKRIGIGRDEKAAEEISETMRTIAAIRILRTGCKPPYASIYGQHDNRPWSRINLEIGRNK